jgi:DNA-binding response OmpR family regulator
MHIVLVEDDAPLAEFIATALRAQGWRADVSARGEPVAASLQRDDCDALILDIGLPGIDGLETLRRALTRRHELRRSEVLMLAALRFDASARRAYIDGRPVHLSARHRGRARADHRRARRAAGPAAERADRARCAPTSSTRPCSRSAIRPAACSAAMLRCCR